MRNRPNGKERSIAGRLRRLVFRRKFVKDSQALPLTAKFTAGIGGRNLLTSSREFSGNAKLAIVGC